MKKTITEVETAIENRIAELEEEYELDIYDRNDIREEEYQKGGWKHDPYPEELDEEEEEDEEPFTFSSILASVFAPAMPSTSSPFSFWKFSTAVLVPVPKFPSLAPLR